MHCIGKGILSPYAAYPQKRMEIVFDAAIKAELLPAGRKRIARYEHQRYKTPKAPAMRKICACSKTVSKSPSRRKKRSGRSVIESETLL